MPSTRDEMANELRSGILSFFRKLLVRIRLVQVKVQMDLKRVARSFGREAGCVTLVLCNLATKPTWVSPCGSAYASTQNPMADVLGSETYFGMHERLAGSN